MSSRENPKSSTMIFHVKKIPRSEAFQKGLKSETLGLSENAKKQ